MTSVISETAISLAPLADPHVLLPGKLLSMEGRYAEVLLQSEDHLSQSSLVQFQSVDTLYLGEVQAVWAEAGAPRIRVLIEHSVDLNRAAAIRRLWNTDNP